MSINAISSVSLYEYFYKINNKDENSKKESPIAKEMREYGLTPTDNESLNIAMLQKAKNAEKNQNSSGTSSEILKSDRPWADLMYQLNLEFNDDPYDDIQDIKAELSSLVAGLNDDELEKEVSDLRNYVENLYVDFQQNYSGSIDTSSLLTNQLNNLSLLNRANFL